MTQDTQQAKYRKIVLPNYLIVPILISGMIIFYFLCKATVLAMRKYNSSLIIEEARAQAEANRILGESMTPQFIEYTKARNCEK